MDPGLPPLDVAALRRVGGPLGSNPGGVFEDAEGRRFYVKTLESAAHARNEFVAAALYRLAGAPTLRYRRTREPAQVATSWIALDKRHVASLDAAERRQAQRWFGVHAWTANWDAAGFHGDNQGVAAGIVLTLAGGGALAFRAQGERKGDAFGTRVGEFDALRRDPDNPHAVRLFGAMDASALREAIEVVTRLPDERIWLAIAEAGGSRALVHRMLARKADLAARAEGLRA